MELTVPPRLDAAAIDGLASEVAGAAAGVLVLRGSAGCFCRGMQLDARDTSALVRFAELLLALRGKHRPTVAVVDGDALGGGLGLLAACDVVIASPRARFGLPEALFGLVPGMVLPVVQERVGPSAARRLALRGLAIPAEEALRIGLVDVMDADLDRALRGQAKLLARAHAAPVRWLKAVPDALRAEVLAGAQATAARLADPEVAAAHAAFEDGGIAWSR